MKKVFLMLVVFGLVFGTAMATPLALASDGMTPIYDAETQTYEDGSGLTFEVIEIDDPQHLYERFPNVGWRTMGVFSVPVIPTNATLRHFREGDALPGFMYDDMAGRSLSIAEEIIWSRDDNGQSKMYIPAGAIVQVQMRSKRNLGQEIILSQTKIIMPAESGAVELGILCHEDMSDYLATIAVVAVGDYVMIEDIDVWCYTTESTEIHFLTAQGLGVKSREARMLVSEGLFAPLPIEPMK